MIKEKLRKLFHITSIREVSIEKLQKMKKEANQSSIMFLAIGVFMIAIFAWISGFTSHIMDRMIMISIGISLFALHIGLMHMSDNESLEIKIELRMRELEQRLREKDG
jgi:hypothetical protein